MTMDQIAARINFSSACFCPHLSALQVRSCQGFLFFHRNKTLEWKKYVVGMPTANWPCHFQGVRECLFWLQTLGGCGICRIDTYWHLIKPKPTVNAFLLGLSNLFLRCSQLSPKGIHKWDLECGHLIYLIHRLFFTKGRLLE